MRVFFLILGVLFGTPLALLAQGRWSYDFITSYDVALTSTLKSVEYKSLETDWSDRFQLGIGFINSSPVRMIDPYIRVHAHRKGLTYNMDSRTTYAFSIGVMPEVGAQFKLTPFDRNKPTRGRWVINTSVGYSIPLVNYLKEDDKRGLAIDYPKGFFSPGAEVSIGLGYDLRKSEKRTSTNLNEMLGSITPRALTTRHSSFRGHMYVGIDYVHGLGNFFNPSQSGLKGTGSYLRLKFVIGAL